MPGICALGAVAFIPSVEGFWTWNGAIAALVLGSNLLHDDGTTVWPFYVGVVAVPMIVFKSAACGGWWSLWIFLFIFGEVPLADYLVGVDVGNQTRAEQKHLHHAFWMKLQTILVCPVVAGSIAYGAWYCAHEATSLPHAIGVGLSVGVISGAIGIVVGHELCHKASPVERVLGRFLLVAVGYGHFYVEHTLGHHKMVATDEDPATARPSRLSLNT